MHAPVYLKVSVIIPTFNRANLISYAIQSLLDQTRVPDEIIVVDDGSTDDTPAVLAKYSSPVVVIRQENKDRSAARNTGLKRAQGDLITFLDSDDILPPDSIEKRTREFQDNSFNKVVYNDVAIIDASGKIIGSYAEAYPRPSGDIFGQLAKHNFIPIHGFMFYRDAYEEIGGFDESLRYFEDFDFLIRLAARYSFQYLNEPLSYYRFHETMTTKTEEKLMLANGVKVYGRVFSMPAFEQLSPLEKSAIYSAHGTRYAMLGQMAKAREWYFRAIKVAPTITRSYAMIALSLLGSSLFEGVIQLIKKTRGDNAAFTI